MATDPRDSVGAAQAVRQELGGQRLTQAFARTYSQHVLLRTGQEGLASWSDGDFSDRLRDVIALIQASFVGRENGEEDWAASLRRAGELLEWLNHPKVNQEALPLALLGAACYQVAGYPARASGLIRTYSDSEPDNSVLESLLRGDFPGAFDSALALVIDSGEEPEPDLKGSVRELERLAYVEFARALAVIAAELRWGDEARLDTALGKLSHIQTALAPFIDPYLWLLLRLSAEVAASANLSSLRQHLRLLDPITTDAGQEVLDRYARFAYSKQRSLAWPSQIRGYGRLAEKGSFALCAPTGSGKTAVAEVALLLGLFERDRVGLMSFDTEMSAPLCLYIVPTRALAAEVEAKLSTVLKSVSGSRAVTVTGLYGGTDWGPADAWLTKNEPTVLICTQEKAEALVRFFGPAFLHRLSLVIVDEAHEVQDAADSYGPAEVENRALRLESLIARLRASLESQGTRFIAISAVAEEIEAELAQWISGGDDRQPVRSRYRSTRQLVGRLIASGKKMRIEYDLLDGSALEFDADANEGPYVPNPFPPQPHAPDMVGPQKGTAPYALWAAMNLAARRGDGETPQSVLISIVQGRANFMSWFLRLLEEDWSGVDLPVFFEEPTAAEDRLLWSRALSMCLDYFGEDSREYQLLKHGIVVHHGKMPGRLPGVLVRLVERRIVRIVVATSTLSQGVNLPFETVLVPVLKRKEFISGREFGNLIGRAGRPGVSTEGQALVILQRGDGYRASLAGYRQVLSELSRTNATKPAVSALASLIARLASNWASEDEMYEWLERTAPTEITGEVVDPRIDVMDVLDGILIASIEELASGEESDLTDDTAEALLRRAWSQTFAHYASAEEARLGEIYLRRGHALLTSIYPEQPKRRRYYKATLPPRDAEALFALLPDAVEHLESGHDYVEWDAGRRFEYVARTIDLVATMPRFQMPTKVGKSKTTSWRDVLTWWLRPDQAEKLPTSAQVADWHSFVAAQFGYLFNWGLGSLISLITDEAAEGSLSPEDWEQTGLPWAVIWIKEMVMWGTLEPVGAYLLARGQEDTRPEANRRALDYYASRAEDPTDIPILSPDAVRDWAMAQLDSRKRELTLQPPKRINVELGREFGDGAASRTWRVLPVERDERLFWVDPAGYVLATSRSEADWRREFVQTYDFFLEPQSGSVVSQAFL